MNLNTTDRKQLNNRFVELKPVKDNSGNYSVRTTYQGKNVVGGGAAKVEEELFPNKAEATIFFNNQN